jgi:hypothetical protein
MSFACAGLACAQPIVRNDENLASTRPEAWAMNYVGASTLFTSFGATPALGAWQWAVAGDLAQIPRLSREQTQVGLGGVKFEDLNKSPVFGRLRVMLGLPEGFVAELGWTPPLTIEGVQPQDFFAASLGRRLFQRDAFSLSMQLFAQHGRAQGDITCPATIAGNPDRQQNPFGCKAPSNDHVYLNNYGVEVIAGVEQGAWHAHASLGEAWTDYAVQVDAFTNAHDLSYLTARGQTPFATFGLGYDFDRRWSAGAEVLYAPLRVQRMPPDGPTERDPFTGVRLQLVFRFD